MASLAMQAGKPLTAQGLSGACGAGDRLALRRRSRKAENERRSGPVHGGAAPDSDDSGLQS